MKRRARINRSCNTPEPHCGDEWFSKGSTPICHSESAGAFERAPEITIAQVIEIVEEHSTVENTRDVAQVLIT